MYLFGLFVSGKGPTMSSAHFSNGSMGVSVITMGALVIFVSLLF